MSTNGIKTYLTDHDIDSLSSETLTTEDKTLVGAINELTEMSSDMTVVDDGDGNIILGADATEIVITTNSRGVDYDSTQSGLSATNVQEAIDEVATFINGKIISVLASKWILQDDGTYTNTVAFTGLTGDETVDVSLYEEAPTEEQSIAFDELIISIETGVGQIIFTASKRIEVSFDVLVRGKFDLEYDMSGSGTGGSNFTGNAEDVTYDNTTSGLESTNVQDAIDEMSVSVNGKVLNVPVDGWVAQDDGTYINTIIVEELSGNETLDVNLYGDFTEEQATAFDNSVTDIDIQSGQIVLIADEQIAVAFDILIRGKVDIDNNGTGGASTAAAVSYDNTTSGMTATTAQEAIDELSSDIAELKNAINGIVVDVPVEGWVAQDDGTYINTVTVDGLSGDENLDISLYGEATEEQAQAFDELVTNISRTEDQITFTASEQITVAFNVLIRGQMDGSINSGTSNTTAEQIIYDNSTSGLEAVNVQGAVDELATGVNTLNSEMKTYKTISLSDLFESFNITPSSHVIYRKGDHIYGSLMFAGAATSSASGTILIGTLKTDYRPRISQNCATNINTLKDGQVHNSRNIRIGSSGYFGVYLGEVNQTIGSTNYPWCTTDGLTFDYEL